MVSLLNAARWLLADAQLSASEGRLDDAADAVDGLRALTFVLASDFPTVVQIMGYAIEGGYVHGLQGLLAAGYGDADFLERHSLTAGPEVAQRFRSMIGVEAGMLRHAMESTERDGLMGRLALGVADLPLAVMARDGYVYYSGVLTAAEGTLAEIQSGRFDAELEHPRRRGWFPLPSLVPEYRAILIRSKAAEARQQLAKLAVRVRLEALRTGAYPEQLDDFEEASSNPLTGLGVTYRTLEDGGVELEIEGGAELVGESLAPVMRELQPIPPFVWRLPPAS